MSVSGWRLGGSSAIGFGLVMVSAAFGDQAASGGVDGARTMYELRCASCHGSGFGGGFGPALSGSDFRGKFADRMTLGAYIEEKMPPAAPHSLTHADASALAGLIADANNIPKSTPAAPASDFGKVDVAVAKTTVAMSSPDVARVADGPSAALYTNAIKARGALAARLSPVTSANLAHPSDADWLMWRRTFDANGYSPLKQIDRSNVAELTLAWSRSLSPGINAIAPLIHDGVLFLNASGKVLAVNAATGVSIWEYAGNAGLTSREPHSQPRSMAIAGERLFVSTLDGHVIALDFRTGKPLWDRSFFDPAQRLEMSAGPIVVDDVVMQGVSGCQGKTYAGGCFILGLDATTGAERWRFHTVARPGQPGGDSWNGADVEHRFGGSVWTPGSYDPETGLVYFGVGQTYHPETLLKPNPRKGASSDALYTDSTVALDPKSGRLVWYYQHMPGDVWDMDWAFERTLVSLPGPKGPVRAVVTAGKPGIIDALDARTGHYLFSIDLGLQTLIDGIDPHTGAKHYSPQAKLSEDHSTSICPYVGGARSWLATAYDPGQGLLYMPMMETCMDISLQPSNPALSEFGGWSIKVKERPNSDGLSSRVAAIDLISRRVRWADRRRAPVAGAALATAGGILFTGSSDHVFRAIDSHSGATLWQTTLANTPNAFPISFSVSGTQYIAIVTGGDSPFDLLHRQMAPEFPSIGDARTLYVFALPAKPEKANASVTRRDEGDSVRNAPE